MIATLALAKGQPAAAPPPSPARRQALPSAFRTTAPGPRWSIGALPVLPKLTIGAADDPLEAEADRVADQAMRMPAPALRVTAAPTQVRRKCAACAEEDEKLRMKPAAAPRARIVEAPPIVHDVLREPGRPLDSETREFFEPRFGRNLGDVRLHVGGKAAEATGAARARAFTVGRNIVFSAGEYSPSSAEGRSLLAHELAHTVQDQPGRALRQPQDNPPSPGAAVSAAAGAPTSGFEVSVNVSLPGNFELKRIPTDQPSRTNVIHTDDDPTQVFITLDGRGLGIHFAPDLLITNHADSALSPDFNVWVSSVRWDFHSQMVVADCNARGITFVVNWGNPCQGIADGVATFLQGQLPGRVFVKDYDPFSDPAILTDLAGFGRSGSSGAASGLPPIRFAQLSASFTLDADVTRTAGAGVIAILSGSRIELSVTGQVPGNDAAPKIDSVRLSIGAGAGGASLNLRAFDMDVPLLRLNKVELHNGGALTFDYTTVTEDLEFIARVFLVAEVVRSGRGGELGEDALTAKQPRIHAIIDSRVRPKLEPMLRDFIIAHRGAIPGIDLAKSLGVESP
jgi:hypothetical protein